jgi:PAS domain-containing protein
MDSILNSAYNGIIALDAEKNIIGINKSAADIYEVDREGRHRSAAEAENTAIDFEWTSYLYWSLPCRINARLGTIRPGESHDHAGSAAGLWAESASFRTSPIQEAVNKDLAVVKENEKIPGKRHCQLL